MGNETHGKGDSAFDGAPFFDDAYRPPAGSFSNVLSPREPPTLADIKAAKERFWKSFERGYAPERKIIPPWMYDELQRAKVEDPEFYRYCMALLQGHT